MRSKDIYTGLTLAEKVSWRNEHLEGSEGKSKRQKFDDICFQLSLRLCLSLTFLELVVLITNFWSVIS